MYYRRVDIGTPCVCATLYQSLFKATGSYKLTLGATEIKPFKSVLFKDAVVCLASMRDESRSMEYWSHDTDMEKQSALRESCPLPICSHDLAWD